jgi:hypothetical protein
VSYVGEQRGLEFPTYERTPRKMRIIIDACTAGRKGWEERLPVVRREEKLVLRRRERDRVIYERNAELIQKEATGWWKKELAEACDFLEKRAETEKDGNRESSRRLVLGEVLDMLRVYGREHCILAEDSDDYAAQLIHE